MIGTTRLGATFVGDHDLRSCLRETLRDSVAQPGAAARDERDLPFHRKRISHLTFPFYIIPNFANASTVVIPS